MNQDKIKSSNCFKTTFPQYLSGIINRHSKHKQVQQIKEEIKKMIPFPSINKQQKQSLIQSTTKLKQRQTVSNFFLQPATKIFLSLQSRPAFCSSTQKDFRPAKMNKKQSQPVKLAHYQQQNSNLEEQQSMKEWRQQMMRHIRQKKVVQYKTIETQSKVIEKERYKEKQKEKEILSPKMSKIKSAPANIKKMQKSSTKPTFIRSQQGSQRNIILIKPTLIPDEKQDRFMTGNKIQPLKIKKPLTFDKFYNNNNYFEKESDQLTLQKIANFQALLPFLGTKKARVQNKQQKRQSNYEVKLSIEQYNKKKKANREKSQQIKQKITGWQTNYD